MLSASSLGGSGDRARLSGEPPAPPEEREHITEAMLDLSFERGYRNIDLPMLLERAGLDEAAFHRHFEDLEDCFCAVYQEARDGFLARVKDAIADLDSWRDRIRATAYLFLEFFREDERVTYLSVVDVRTAGERPQRLFSEAFTYLMDLLDEGRGELADPDSMSHATAEAVGGGIFGQMYSAVDRGSLDLGEDAIPKLMYAAVLPYLGPDAAAEELDIPPPPTVAPADGAS
jgi:AcrR family transcriptional regulator